MWNLYITAILCLTTSIAGEKPKIVIIGAGAAGIAAASKLYQHGLQNVTILEAEDRIGGRVYTTMFDNVLVDLGGQQVHGEKNNTVFELAEPLGLLEVPESKIGLSFTAYNSEGSRIPNSISEALIEMYFDISVSEKNLSSSNGSIGEYLINRINIEVKKYPKLNQTLLKQFVNLFEGFQMGSDAADNWHEVSARGHQVYRNCPGNQLVNWKDRGYGTILDILMKKYPNPEEELPILNNTILNSEVVNIDYNTTSGKAVVEISTGRKYVADHVIVTPSLGVLKANYGTLFTPKLPDYKVKTIKGLAFGTVAKIYLSFEKPWWPDNSTNFVFLWNEDDRLEYENDPDKKWLLGVIAALSVPHKPRLLNGWLSGASARYMETLSDDQVLSQTLGLFNKFLGKTYNVTKPTGILRTKWYSNKHFRGTYSSRGMKSEAADVWASGLAEPLLVNNKPIVMFAGEATHDHYYSTVHGAIETGFREATRLIYMYNNKTTTL